MMNKIYVYLFTFLLLNSCGVGEYGNDSVYTDNDWHSILETAFRLANVYKQENVFLYEKFDNELIEDTILFAYTIGAEIYGYKILDSKKEFIRNRESSYFSNNLDTILNIKYISDTVIIAEYFVFSEPFYIDKNKICFSLSYVRKNQGGQHWIYFTEKSEDKVKILDVYDVNEDALYGVKKLY